MIEIMVTKNTKNSFSLIRGILPFIIITGIVTLLFAGPQKAFLLVLRIVTGTLLFSLFIITTNPTDFSKLIEKIHVPVKFAIIPGISLSLIPRTLKDIEETYNTIYLRGEIKGSFIKWLPRLLAISISSIIYRSTFIEESLTIRGFTMKNRKRLGPNHKLSIKDIVKLAYWLVVFFVMFVILIRYP